MSINVFMFHQKLKKVLSSEALKITIEPTNATESKKERSNTATSLDSSVSKSPLTRMQSTHGASLLRQLVSEQASKFIATAEVVSLSLELEAYLGPSQNYLGHNALRYLFPINPFSTS